MDSLFNLRLFIPIVFCLQTISVYPSLNKHLFCLDCDSSEPFLDINDSENEIDNLSQTGNYSSYREAYFDNLTTNYGMNYKGSCGYVAMGMLLSYYDNYLDDFIISDNYDEVTTSYDTNMILSHNSPGIFHDELFDPHDPNNLQYGSTLDMSIYISLLEAARNVSFHANLILIGEQLGIWTRDDIPSDFGTSCSDRVLILNHYLSNVLGLEYGTQYELSYVDYDNFFSMSDAVKTFAAQEIQNGYPVILSIVDNNGSAHAVLGYNYNQNTGRLGIHAGLGYYQTNVTIDDLGYQYYRSALSIHFNIPHSHSNNYVYINDDNSLTSYCYDSCQIVTWIDPPLHLHNSSYLPYSSTSHKAFCLCGHSENQPHSVLQSSIITIHGINYAPCIFCGYLVNLSNGGVLIRVTAPNIRQIPIIYTIRDDNCIIVVED